jgi:hypothetical protein
MTTPIIFWDWMTAGFGNWPGSQRIRPKAKTGYQEDIKTVFAHCLQSMPSGGRLIIVANDKSTCMNQSRDLGIIERRLSNDM